MENKVVSGIMLTLLLMSMLTLTSFVAPANSWVYPWCDQDQKFEQFGPRLDRIVVRMYASTTDMWEAMLRGEIDVTDMPLTKTYYDIFFGNPNFKLVEYPPPLGEAGYYIEDINHNNNDLLGNPPGTPPGYPNPVINYPEAGCRNPCSDVWFRRAIAYIVNRTWITTTLLPGFSFALYTPMPIYMDPLGWVNRDIAPGQPLEALCYLTNATEANRILDTNGFPINQSTGWRYWDRNHNGVQDLGEAIKLITWTRNDLKLGLFEVGLKLNADLTTLLHINVEDHYGDSSICYDHVMLEKNYHLYTGEWLDIGPEPDYLYDFYHSSMYWHNPESSCPNTGFINDPTIDALAEGIKFGTDLPTIQATVWDFQERFALMAHEIPLYCSRGVKVSSKTHVGFIPNENPYPGKEWKNLVNEQGFGTNSYWTFLNAHVDGYPYGVPGSLMRMRYGWSTINMPRTLNLLYASSYWEHEVLNKIYDTLAVRDPNNRGTYLPWLIKRWEKGLWKNPVTGLFCDKVTVTIRPDVVWNDGTPMTMADVIFSFDEAVKLLLAKGYAPPWWYPAVQNLVSVEIIDAYTVELLYGVQSAWTEQWALLGVPIIPKHIWKPIIESGDPTAFYPDETRPDKGLVGTGPFKYISFTPATALVLDRNPIYWKRFPKDVNVHADNYQAKINLPHDLGKPPVNNWTLVNFTVTDHNLIQEQFWLESNIPGYDVILPPVVDTLWHGTWPPGITTCEFQVIFWYDQNGDSMLSPCDIIWLETPPGSGKPIFFHVHDAYFDGTYWHIEVMEALFTNKYVYIDGQLLPSYPATEWEKPCVPIVETITVNLTIGRHTIKVAKHIENDWHLMQNNEVIPNPWYCNWVNATLLVWVTIKEDIVSRTFYDDIGMPTYPYKTTLPTPDFKVDIKDIATVAKAYGSYPGHPKWNPVADINGDYKIDIKDYVSVARQFAPPKLLGDVNGDGKVDGKDIALCAKCFGKVIGQPDYLPEADVNLDTKIDGKDIAITASHFGERDPP